MLRFRILSFQLAVSASSTLAAFSRAMSSSNVGSSKIAVAQLCSSSSKLKNLKSVAKCARLAKHENCSMLFLPECFGFMGESSEQTLAQAEPPVLDDATVNDPTITETLKSIVTSRLVDSEETDDGDSGIGIGHYKHISLLEGLRQIARASGLWISAGGMHVAGAPPEQARDRVYNTHVVLDNDGTVVGIYRKIHLFDVSIPGKVDLRESATTAAGEDLVVCDSPIGRLGLSTCYDVRFPEMYVDLVERGAEVLLVPSAFTVPTGSAHWHILLRARAIESQCFVVAAAQFGQHNKKRASYGHSLVVDPWGEILADAGGFDSDNRPTTCPSIITCEIDRSRISSVRERMPIQTHRANAKMRSA